MFPKMLKGVRDGELEKFLNRLGVDYDELIRAADALEEETDATTKEAFIIGFALAIREIQKVVTVEIVSEGRPMKRRPGLDRRRRNG